MNLVYDILSKHLSGAKLLFFGVLCLLGWYVWYALGIWLSGKDIDRRLLKIRKASIIILILAFALSCIKWSKFYKKDVDNKLIINNSEQMSIKVEASYVDEGSLIKIEDSKMNATGLLFDTSKPLHTAKPLHGSYFLNPDINELKSEPKGKLPNRNTLFKEGTGYVDVKKETYHDIKKVMDKLLESNKPFD